MNKLRVIDVREEVAEVAGKCATVSGGTTNPEVVQLINEAQRRLAKRGHWVGTVQRYKINVDNALITWPRQVNTIEAVAFCNDPGIIRNEWFEFLGHGPGLLDCESCLWHTLVDRGTAVTFKDITAGETNRKLRVYADVNEAADQYITLQGYDENGNWIRTQDGDDWIDGERVEISTTPVLSTKFFKCVTGVYKPTTNGVVRVYEYDDDEEENVQLIGYYEPDEKTPIYRRSLLPGIMDTETCNDCEDRQITVAVKLRCLPVSGDNDWLAIGDIDAVKLAVQAVLKERNNLQGEAEHSWQKAGRELEQELKQYQGDGVVVAPRVEMNFGAGSIPVIY
jgi:hypothetical protein